MAMRRRRVVEAAQGLPALPDEERRDQQVKVRLSRTEAERLRAMRPDLTVSGIAALVIDDVLAGRYVPAWAAPSGDAVEPE
ncbi:hypothetical protein F8271_10110 [Micromonospora sp. ALFpr18c]|uniref:hypothetical protein n=1 Tax=Micromonospora sp. ALFpr18c TaxID=1458665 RepID=UPI00124BBE00|nr:hypothetical protein [Micromonospora sp. ALFpr18c]KAB1943435.1 hypothetical protein F8271_10110 [Micromonospora sp. ALFpr18c]